MFPNINDPIISGPVRDVLLLLRDSIVKVRSGFSDPLLFSDLTDRSKASMVWDTFTREAVRRFEDHPEVNVFENNQLIFVQIAGINIRLRKADKDSLRIAKNSTRQTTLWTKGRQAVLPGFEDPSFQLFLTYCPDDTWSKMERCVIGLYRDDTPVAYRELDLDDEPELISPQPAELPERGKRALRFKDSVDAVELPLSGEGNS